jgi:2,5-diketo-D-gluconate reductase A
MTDALPIPSILLNSGTTIPQLGFGVFQVEPAETARILGSALEIGYRHIDTAALYNNEEGVGEAIRSSGIPRDELFVTTKLWNTDQSPKESMDAFDASLEKLGLESVDLYLIHWPAPKFHNYVATWEVLGEIAESGRAKAIGVSNFQPAHLKKIMAETGIVPAVNQIELHPEFQQRDVVAYCAEQGIAIEAWSPLASGNLMNTPEITALAEAHGKSVAQATLRWHIQQGRIIFPKSNNPERQRENFEIFDFELSEEELAAFDALDSTDGRVGPNPDNFDAKQ